MSASTDSRQNETDPNGRNAPTRNRVRRLAAWAARRNLERKVAIVLVVGGVASGLATFAAMTDNFFGVADPTTILLLLNADLVFLLAIGALIARRLVMVWVARRRGRAGARLHARLVGLFSLVAVAPAIVLAVFSVLFFNYGLQGWFSERVSTALDASLEVAQSYLEEHRETINADVLSMANDLNREGPLLMYNQQRFQRTLATQAALRSLTEAVVFDSSGRVIARAGFSLMLEFDPEVPDWAMQRAEQGDVVTLTAGTEDRVRALIKLDNFVDAYLYVGRLVDPKILNHIDRTENAVQLYKQLEGKRSTMQITFALIFMVVAMLLLLASVWVGLAFANQLTQPIGQLIMATERVRSGDLTTRAPPPETRDEVDSLTRAFNRMTGQLQTQQTALVDANRQLDERRRFTEAVLSGVTAGVIGLDPDGRIDLPNTSACRLLETTRDKLIGRPLHEIAPQMAKLAERARKRPGRGAQDQIQFTAQDGRTLTLLVRVTAEQEAGRPISGFVVTFDDITELLSAQRKAAWADVARRIAHEIKNPLTPIQLSAERLKRRYLKQIEQDPETFKACTDTIVRQVTDIGRMVDEFSNFARMPEPVMESEDLNQLAEQAVFLQETANPDLSFARELSDQPARLSCDRRQIDRALTNLVQNAIEAVRARPEAPEQPKGEVRIRVRPDEQAWIIEVLDNGRGLPVEERDKLTEPYVTTRDHGTGLGLAIVKKIMEDHGGEVRLTNRPEGGACVRLILPVGEDAGQSGDDQPPNTDIGRARVRA
ncbi:sensor histidine kinase NtrY-like [Rhodovibrio salinarum]|uniref:Nitrogen regulation protein n=1 Tax=Rhodovibrio salinarum TaxID=1087 RepID=A0A934V0H2_9PROT|nr:PAS domain-containing sensor histidine kinase [Rhodovibrio salinarum]MBK1697858.1 two-component sensor histidine kinase [Rhodovibrio salinarum]